MALLDFILCHGFGYDARYWQRLCDCLAPHRVHCLDRGYWGQSVTMAGLDSNRHYVGVGHSLGLMHLMQQGIAFKQLIGLNAFVHFLGHNRALNHKRGRELSSLTHGFTRNPEATLQGFYARVGVDLEPCMSHMNHAALTDDLRLLRHHQPVIPHVPMLILGSMDDRITPAELLEDNFAGLPGVIVDMTDGVGHGLGYLKSTWVHQRMMRFCEHGE
jgi:pimeloyl-[acyl-carrier protein] methyl ester esterase